MKRLIVLIVWLSLLITINTNAQWSRVTNDKPMGLGDIAFADSLHGTAAGALGFYTTNDGGNKWDLYADWNYLWLDYKDVHFTTNQIGWILGYDSDNSYLIKTTDAGSSWNTMSIPSSTGFMYRMYWSNKDTGYICGSTRRLFGLGDTTGTNAGMYWETNNGGISWVVKNIGKPKYGFRDIVMLSNGVGYLVGPYIIYTTSDKGQNWTKLNIATHPNEVMHSMYFINNRVGYLFGFYGFTPSYTWVYKTTDGGKNWMQVSELKGFDIGNYNPVCIIDENNFVLSGYTASSVEIRRTVDAGKTWLTDYSIYDFGQHQIQSVIKVGRTFWGAGDQIHKCSNLPPNFTSVIGDSVALVNTLYKQPITVTDPDGDVVTLSIAQPNFLNIQNSNITGTPTDTGTYTVLVIADDNHGGKDTLSYKLKVETAVGVEDENSIPTKYQLSQNYPNPFNPTTTINYSLPKSGNVRLIVVNSLGQEVSTLVNEFRSVGSHSVTFNASNLPSGIYFYRIIAGNFTEVKKMILIK